MPDLRIGYLDPAPAAAARVAAADAFYGGRCKKPGHRGRGPSGVYRPDPLSEFIKKKAACLR